MAALETATTKELEAGGQADRRAVGLKAACESAVAESQRWKRREMLVRQQIAGLTERAERLDRDAQSLDAERDVLARERDALKAALTKASRRSGYAVLPYKGPNGTWQRPIVLECTAGGVKLQLQGRTFTALELSPLIHRRSSPFVKAIAQELLHIRSADTPDGAPAVPYLVFLVRPDGIRAYYEARTCLEPLGIAFGYELIEQDLVVDIPDFDDLTTWDGTVPLEMALEPAPRPNSTVAARSSTGNAGSGSSHPDNSSPEDFVWPGRGRHAVDDDSSGSGTADRQRNGALTAGIGTGQAAQTPGGGRAGLEAGAASPGSSVDQQRSSGEALDVAGSSISPIGTGVPAGNGSGTSPLLQDNGSLPGLARGPLGAGSGQVGAGGLNPLPDLEPAGDSGAPLPLQPRLGLSTQQASSAGLDAGGQSQGPGSGSAGVSTAAAGGMGSSSAAPGGARQSYGFGPDRTGMGSAAPGGTGSSLAAPGGAGQAEGLGPDRAGMVTGSPGDPGLSSAAPVGGKLQGSSPGQVGMGLSAMRGEGAPAAGAPDGDPSQQSGRDQKSGLVRSADGTGSSAADPLVGGQMPGSDPPPNGAGTTPGNRSSSPGGPAPSSQPFSGQLAAYASDLQASHGSSSDSGLASSSSANSQPPLGSSLSGEFSPSSSSTNPSFGMPSSSSTSAAPSSSSTNPSFGMPSSSSTSAAASASSSMGGMPLGSTSSTSSPQSSSSSFSWGQDGGLSSDSKTEMVVPPRPRPAPPMGSIEVPFEIVVVCRRYDVLLHPGGYRLTLQAMREQGAGNDGLLAREIRAMVHRRAFVDPMIRPKPSIRFLVETYGAQAFWTARRQLLFSLPDWPMSLQVSNAQEPHVLSEETW